LVIKGKMAVPLCTAKSEWVDGVLKRRIDLTGVHNAVDFNSEGNCPFKRITPHMGALVKHRWILQKGGYKKGSLKDVDEGALVIVRGEAQTECVEEIIEERGGLYGEDRYDSGCEDESEDESESGEAAEAEPDINPGC